MKIGGAEDWLLGEIEDVLQEGWVLEGAVEEVQACWGGALGFGAWCEEDAFWCDCSHFEDAW